MWKYIFYSFLKKHYVNYAYLFLFHFLKKVSIRWYYFFLNCLIELASKYYVGFPLWEVLNYGFDCFNRYRTIQIFCVILRQFYPFVPFKDCLHLCCRIYWYEVAHMTPLLTFLETVLILTPDIGNLYLHYFP